MGSLSLRFLLCRRRLSTRRRLLSLWRRLSTRRRLMTRGRRLRSCRRRLGTRHPPVWRRPGLPKARPRGLRPPHQLLPYRLLDLLPVPVRMDSRRLPASCLAANLGNLGLILRSKLKSLFQVLLLEFLPSKLNHLLPSRLGQVG